MDDNTNMTMPGGSTPPPTTTPQMSSGTGKSSSGMGMMVLWIIVALLVGGVAGWYFGNMQGKKEAKTVTVKVMDATTDGVTVGGAKMVNTLNIIENASKANNVTTLVNAVKAADLTTVLQGTGPYTVFAPTNAAFQALPAGTLDNLLKPENKTQLVSLIEYHIVPGAFTSAELKAMAQKNQTLTTMQGGVLTPVIVDGKLKIKDAKGNVVDIANMDIISNNGVTYIVNGVLMP